jgi:hypothetical protein
MPSEPRAAVLPFRTRPGIGSAPERPEVPAIPPGSREDALNASWDHLLWLAIQAWSWRDPESLGAIELAVEALARDVQRDWS